MNRRQFGQIVAGFAGGVAPAGARELAAARATSYGEQLPDILRVAAKPIPCSLPDDYSSPLLPASLKPGSARVGGARSANLRVSALLQTG